MTKKPTDEMSKPEKSFERSKLDKKVDKIRAIKKKVLSNMYGWICPKCSAVHAPFVAGCDKCNNMKPVKEENKSIAKELEKFRDQQRIYTKNQWEPYIG